MNTEHGTQPQPTERANVLPLEARKAVQKWSNSFFRPSIPTNLIDKSVDIEINNEQAKVLTAQFLYGERNGEQHDYPYDGREFTNEITDKSLETLWLYRDTDAPRGFVEKTMDSFRIDTGKKKKCKQCRGFGKVTCSKCNGTRIVTKHIDGRNQSSSCTCGDGKQNCRNCDGYGEVHTVIVINTCFKVESSRRLDYNGQIPESKLNNSSGIILFEESVNYRKESATQLIRGGVNPAEYARLQANLSELFHSLIGKKLTNYDSDVEIVHTLVDDFLKRMPNACEENKLLEHEILPVRIGFKIEDVPVKRVAYTYKGIPYTLWVYGREQNVFAKKRPRGFTGRLIVSWAIQLVILGLMIYWLTGWPRNQASVTPTSGATNSVEASKPDASSYDKTRQAAERGNPQSQWELGLLYCDGGGVAKDSIEAVKWFTKAAEQGYARAQNKLGLMYKDGTGVGKNDVQAVKWFRAAAEQGLARAQNNLAISLFYGRGVTSDLVESVKWFRAAAEQGLPAAQYCLGVMYKEGNGLPKDDIQAVKWFSLAAEQGDADAKKEYSILSEDLGRLAPASLRQGQDLAKQFVPRNPE